MKIFRQILARIVFLPLILAAGLAATAMFTIQVMFKPEDVQAIVTSSFQELLRRPVRVESARISYTGEIKIKGFRAVEPGPERVDFLKAEYIYATYRLLPLLQRRIEIDSVVLVSPSISLIKRADGTWNVGDIMAAWRSGSGKAHLMKIDSAEVKDGQLSLTYAASRSSHVFENLNITLSDFKPEGDSSFYASAFFRSGSLRRQLNGRVYTEGTVNFAGFDWEKSELRDLHADLTLLDKSVRITGRVRNLRRPEAELEAETPQFKSADLAYFFSSPFRFTAPRASWKISSAFTSPGIMKLTMTAMPLDIKAEGTFDVSGSTPVYSFLVASPPLPLDQLSGYGAALPLDKLSGKALVRLRITSKDGKPVFSRAFVNASGSGFRYRNLAATGLNLSSLVVGGFSGSYATVSKGRLTLGGNVMSSLRLKTELLKDGVLFNYSGKFNGEAAKGRVLINRPFSTGRTVDFTGYSDELSFAAVRRLTEDYKELRGPRVQQPEADAGLAWLKTLKNSIPTGYSSIKTLYKSKLFRHDYMEASDFYVYAALKDVAGDISKLRGDISIKSGAGTFFDVQQTSEKDRVFYLFSLPLTFIHRMNRVGALKFGYKVKDVPFNSIGGDYTVDEGKVAIRNFYIDGKDFSACVSGTLDFNAETMQVKIYTIYGKYYKMGSLPESLTDASGKPALAFTLEGRMAEPNFKMLSPKESGRFIGEAARKGAEIDIGRIDTFAGGKK